MILVKATKVKESNSSKNLALAAILATPAKHAAVWSNGRELWFQGVDIVPLMMRWESGVVVLAGREGRANLKQTALPKFHLILL